MIKITDVNAVLDPQFQRVSDTPRTDVAEHNMGSVVEPHYVVDAEFSRYLERELVGARKDAERYRWLRERHENTVMDIYNSISPAMKPELLDAAIDAAMKEGGK